MTATTTFSATPMVDDEPVTDRKRLLVLGGAVGAIALAAAGYFLLTGGGESNDDSFVPRTSAKLTAQAAVPGAKVNAATQPLVKPAAALPPTSTAVLGRDPFKPLYVAPVAPVAVQGLTGDTGSTAATLPGASTTYALKLLSVSGTGTAQTATFTIDGKRQLARVGTVFGPTQEVKLLSFQESPKGVWYTVLQVGDSEPFDARIGVISHVR